MTSPLVEKKKKGQFQGLFSGFFFTQRMGRDACRLAFDAREDRALVRGPESGGVKTVQFFFPLNSSFKSTFKLKRNKMSKPYEKKKKKKREEK